MAPLPLLYRQEDGSDGNIRVSHHTNGSSNHSKKFVSMASAHTVTTHRIYFARPYPSVRREGTNEHLPRASLLPVMNGLFVLNVVVAYTLMCYCLLYCRMSQQIGHSRKETFFFVLR